jgi:hypothetical protein
MRQGLFYFRGCCTIAQYGKVCLIGRLSLISSLDRERHILGPAMPTIAGPSCLWIDTLGGYLVCCAPRVSLGAACPSTETDAPPTPLADIAFLAPIRPVHVWVQRDEECYVWEAVGRCQFGGQESRAGIWTPSREMVLLSDAGNPAVRLRLSLPEPGLLTACLTWLPPARTYRHVRSAVLVSQALHLGPAPTAHIRGESLPETWLFPMQDGWLVRSTVPVIFEQRSYTDEVMLPVFWQIRLGDVQLALEPCPAI